MDHNHKSNTAYGGDNYSFEMKHPEWQPEDWRKLWQGGVCYDPKKVCGCMGKCTDLCVCVCVCVWQGGVCYDPKKVWLHGEVQ